MIEIRGRCNTAICYCDEMDEAARQQIQDLCDQPVFAGSRIRIMPDVHAGKACTIGTTMTIDRFAVPNLVGVDIGCGMETVELEERHIDFGRLDEVVRRDIPAGMSVRQSPHPLTREIDLTELRCRASVSLEHAALSLGTLGGGNHFIEVDRDEDGRLYLVIHSGSRHLGLQTANHYQRLGWKTLQRVSDDARQAVIDRCRAEGRARDIEGELAALRQSRPLASVVPERFAWVEGGNLEDYLHDMAIAQRFADLNRKAMMDTILKGMGLKAADRFTTIHNYIDLEAGILRKGAVSAQAGERLLIPINMRDGSLICIGKGNVDWNCSAPHGAGRLMSRSAAKQSFTVSDFKKQMQGIYTTSVGAATLDECPMAYKSMEDIVSNIGPTADIERIIKPIYNFKAGNGD